MTSADERDLELAGEIVAAAGYIVGSMGSMRENIAKLVARGIAEGRRQAEAERKGEDA